MTSTESHAISVRPFNRVTRRLGLDSYKLEVLGTKVAEYEWGISQTQNKAED